MQCCRYSPRQIGRDVLRYVDIEVKVHTTAYNSVAISVSGYMQYYML